MMSLLAQYVRLTGIVPQHVCQGYAELSGDTTLWACPHPKWMWNKTNHSKSGGEVMISSKHMLVNIQMCSPNFKRNSIKISTTECTIRKRPAKFELSSLSSMFNFEMKSLATELMKRCITRLTHYWSEQVFISTIGFWTLNETVTSTFKHHAADPVEQINQTFHNAPSICPKESHVIRISWYRITSCNRWQWRGRLCKRITHCSPTVS